MEPHMNLPSLQDAISVLRDCQPTSMLQSATPATSCGKAYRLANPDENDPDKQNTLIVNRSPNRSTKESGATELLQTLKVAKEIVQTEDGVAKTITLTESTVPKPEGSKPRGRKKKIDVPEEKKSSDKRKTRAATAPKSTVPTKKRQASPESDRDLPSKRVSQKRKGTNKTLQQN